MKLLNFNYIKRFILALLVYLPFNNTLSQQIDYSKPHLDTIPIADPFTLEYEGTYYLYGTNASGKGFKYWTSNDLYNWKEKGFVFKKNSSTWGQSNFWAPEVIEYKDKFYLAYSSKGKTMYGEGMRICIAVADHPEGPFKELYAPLFDYNFSCIDAHIFVDEDNTAYLYYEMVGSVGEFWNKKGFLWGMIYGVELSEDLSHPVNEPTLCLYPTQEWEGINSMWARSVEGMTVFKNDSVYYMTYSGNNYKDPKYGVGYATSDSPLGMWTKSDQNPILSKDLSIGLSGPGHNCVLKTMDTNGWFFFYHSHANPENPSAKRILNIGRLEINADYSLEIK